MSSLQIVSCQSFPTLALFTVLTSPSCILFIISLTGLELVYNVELASGGQQSESVMLLLFSCWDMSDCFVTPWTVAHQAPLAMGFPIKNTRVGCHFLLQGIFPTQGSNPHLLHWQVDSLWLNYQGSPNQSYLYIYPVFFCVLDYFLLEAIISCPLSLWCYVTLSMDMK